MKREEEQCSFCARTIRTTEGYYIECGFVVCVQCQEKELAAPDLVAI